MTLNETYDLFIAELMVEYKKRGIPYDEPARKLTIYNLSEGQNEIADKLNLLLTYSDVSYSAQTSFTELTLPADFGKLRKAEILGNELKITGLTELQTNGTLSQGTPDTIAVYNRGSGWKCTLSPLPSASGTVSVWYISNPLLYDPTGTNTSWGTYTTATDTLSGNLKIPDKYIPLLLLYMKSKIFDEYEAKFWAKLAQERTNLQTTNAEIPYNLGGF